VLVVVVPQKENRSLDKRSAGTRTVEQFICLSMRFDDGDKFPAKRRKDFATLSFISIWYLSVVSASLIVLLIVFTLLSCRLLITFVYCRFSQLKIKNPKERVSPAAKVPTTLS